jgi:hypothetical protein
MASLVLDFGL